MLYDIYYHWVQRMTKTQPNQTLPSKIPWHNLMKWVEKYDQCSQAGNEKIAYKTKLRNLSFHEIGIISSMSLNLSLEYYFLKIFLATRVFCYNHSLIVINHLAALPFSSFFHSCPKSKTGSTTGVFIERIWSFQKNLWVMNGRRKQL